MCTNNNPHHGGYRTRASNFHNSLPPNILPEVRDFLRNAGIDITSGVISYYLNLEVVGKGSPEGQEIIRNFGYNKEHFSEGLLGTSAERLLKVLFDGESTRYMPELLRVLRKLTGKTFYPAPEPDYAFAHREQLKRIDAVAKALLKGRAGDVGVTYDLWRKESPWPVGRPEVAKSEEVSFSKIQSDSPVEQYQVLWHRRCVPIPIGRVFVHEEKLSLLLDGRPYTYTGEPFMAGNKNVLLVRMSAKVRAEIKGLAVSGFLRSVCYLSEVLECVLN